MELRAKGCPHCGNPVDFVFRIPTFGVGGAEIKCTVCGAMMRDTNHTECIWGDGSVATPVTTESMVRCVERCIENWNRRAVSPPHYLQHPVTDEQRDAHLHGLCGEEDNVDD